MKRRKLPARAYPPGHFTQPVRAWRGAFGPLWSPRWPELVISRTSAGGTQSPVPGHAQETRR